MGPGKPVKSLNYIVHFPGLESSKKKPLVLEIC